MRFTGRFYWKILCCFGVASLCVALLSGVVHHSRAAGTPFDASSVVGQTVDNRGITFLYQGLDNAPNSYGFASITDIAVDSLHHRLFVADSENNRVLVFDLNPADNTIASHSASHVLGQPDFRSNTQDGNEANQLASPDGLAYDADDDYLFVADWNNNRIMVFDVATIVDGEAAIHVLGQSDFGISDSDTSDTGLRGPQDVFYDSTGLRLFVADSQNNRIMVWEVPAGMATITNGMAATNVLGQATFDTGLLYGDGGPTPTIDGLGSPYSIAYDSTNTLLFVGEYAGRVMVFDVGSIVDGENAINVLGYTQFDKSDTPTDQNKVAIPYGLTYDDANDRLFAVDRGAGGGAQRVAVFDLSSGITNGMNASNVLGQETFTGTEYVVDQDGITGPSAVAYDPTSNYLYVGDSFGYRVMVFNVASITNGEDAVDMIGQIDENDDPVYTAAEPDNSPNAYGVSGASDVIIDTAHSRLFVADTQNYRVLVFNLDPITNQPLDLKADAVLGQADFKSHVQAATQSGLFDARALAYDSANNRLFVSDENGNRVMVFDVADITNGEDAIAVLGQDAFNTSSWATTQDGLKSPAGLAYDSANSRLFVGDAGNNRIMVFNVSTIVNGEDAVAVLGQDVFDTSVTATTQDGLSNDSGPGQSGLAYDSANSRLFVADANNARIMVFDVASITNGEDAINVLGQDAFNTSSAATTQDGLGYPRGLAYDSANNRLFVSEGNNRVTVFDVASITNGENAIGVLGQPDFVTATGCEGDVTQWALCDPKGLSYDGDAHILYVADSTHNRIMLYNLIALTTSSLSDAEVGTAYAESLAVSYNQGTVSYSLAPGSGDLPPGLALGSVEGTPTTAGTYTFTVRATDTLGDIGVFFDDKTYTMTVAGGDVGASRHHDQDVVPTPTPTPTVSPSPSESILPSSTPTPTITPTPTLPLIPTPLILAFSPTPSETPSPSPTPRATPIPTPSLPPLSSPIPLPSLPPSEQSEELPLFSPVTIERPNLPSQEPETSNQFMQSLGNEISTLAASFQSLVALAVSGARDVCGTDAAGNTACAATAVGVLAVAGGIAAGFAQNGAVAATHGFFQIIGLHRKARVWGVIYDSATKHPIPFVKVMLLDASGRVMEVRFADRDGRYGFLTSPTSLHQDALHISIRAEKQGYRFPSSIVTAGTDYIVYDRLYRGEPLTVTKASVLNFSIPMDPIAKQHRSISAFGISFLGRVGEWILSVGFYLGCIAVPINYYLNPSAWSITIGILFIATNAFRILAVYRPYGVTRNAVTGDPMPFALVTLNALDGSRVSYAVADEYGRFILSGPKGVPYTVTAYTPANISPQRTTQARISKLFGRGWVTTTLRF